MWKIKICGEVLRGGRAIEQMAPRGRLCRKKSMEENRFVQLVAGMLYRTDRDSVTPETRYKGLKEWNFLFEVSLAMMLEEEYHVEVTPEDFSSTGTLDELFRRVCAPRLVNKD